MVTLIVCSHSHHSSLLDIAEHDYIGLTTPFMESMALIGAQYALTCGPELDMARYFERVTIAARWIEHQRANTSVREMEYFKERRQVLFRQWGVLNRGSSVFRDDKGKFVNKRLEEQEEEEPTTVKKRRADAYDDLFSEFC